MGEALRRTYRKVKKADTNTITVSIGAATFFFGFGAGALFNLYLIFIGSPVVSTLRTSLTYKSAIFGDGIVLPIVNMTAVLFLIQQSVYLGKPTFILAVIGGTLVTAYFHINQAVRGLVNWAMPAPWQWNGLGLWHAIYMFAVATFLCLFYIVFLKYLHHKKKIPYHFWIVTVGIILFFFLLRLDYPVDII